MFQLCLTRVLRERDLAVRGDDTRMSGPVVRRHATAGRRGGIGSGVQSGSAPDDVAHRHGHRRRDDRRFACFSARFQGWAPATAVTRLFV